MADGYVKTEFHKGVATIEFSHPQSNSLPGILLEQLAQAIHSVGNDNETNVIVIRSTGEKAFCAGASFDELMAIQNEKDGLRFFEGFAKVINAMRKCNKLIIGRIQGKSVGGAVGLVAACDYAIAVKEADVKLSELSLGIGPFVVGPVIQRKIGISAYSQLAIDATLWRNSDWAKKKGLFAEVHDSISNMDESIYRLSNALAHSNPDAMKELKKIFWKDTDNWDTLLNERAAISGKLVLSEFTKNAIAKLKVKIK